MSVTRVYMPITSFSGPYRFLSNFYPCSIVDPELEITFASSEHAYQWSKCAEQSDRDAILAEPKPGKAKGLGSRAVLLPGWTREGMGVAAMTKWLALKFAPGTELAEKLVDTRTALLVEGNDWHDCFWGVCDCGFKNPRRGCTDPPSGANMLGKLLMARREELVVEHEGHVGG
jgi:ribA/ribD-fused uncharacterized protein